jgi:hypothetical protein
LLDEADVRPIGLGARDSLRPDKSVALESVDAIFPLMILGVFKIFSSAELLEAAAGIGERRRVPPGIIGVR